MRNRIFIKSSIAWLAVVCAILFVYQFLLSRSSQQVIPSEHSMLTSNATVVADNRVDGSVTSQVSKVGFAQQTLFVNYAILPDLENTAQTKEFLENVYTTGYIGRNGSFQSMLGELSIGQLLANMMIRPNVISHLRTVQISPSMLTIEQLKSCYILSNILLNDLGNMYRFSDCCQEQITVINTAMRRLGFLKSLFREELESYHAFDPTLDSNCATMDMLRNGGQLLSERKGQPL